MDRLQSNRAQRKNKLPRCMRTLHDPVSRWLSSLPPVPIADHPGFPLDLPVRTGSMNRRDSVKHKSVVWNMTGESTLPRRPNCLRSSVCVIMDDAKKSGGPVINQ